MAWQLSLTPGLLSVLASADAHLLVAVVDEGTSTASVLGAVPVAGGPEAFQATADAVSPLLPGGVHVVGSCSVSGNSPPWQPCSTTAAVCACGTSAQTLKWTVCGSAVAPTLLQPAGSGEEMALGTLHVVPGFVPLRCHTDVELQVVHDAPPALSPAAASPVAQQMPPAAAVREALAVLQDSLLTPTLAAVSEPPPPASGDGCSSVVPPVLAASGSAGSVGDALGSAAARGAAPCVSMLLLQHSGAAGGAGAAPSPAPLFEFTPRQPGMTAVSRLQLRLSVLAYAPAALPLCKLVQDVLAPALRRQLDAAATLLLQGDDDAAVGCNTPAPLEARHFSLLPLGCLPLTLLCRGAAPGQSLEAAEAVQRPLRARLHTQLGLPVDRPLLRAANALSWETHGVAAGGGAVGAAAVPRAARLRNVHEGLAPPGFGGQLFLVDGCYEYCHYMQDKFNDNGWGCAYRSLQTLISWFKLQHYTSKPLPSHRQVQELLVRLGDKDASFVGSSNWIGAIELSYVLDDYLDVTCKVMTINRGADIPSHARALAQHFATQGTPVMIGGGVLAYTLLGVAFNDATGDAAFLILDPHYTGGEELKKIQSGGWVGWKQLGDSAAAGGPLFVQDAFYNFLCPQRPRDV